MRKWLIILIPTLAAFGPQLPLVHPLYAFRVAALALLITAMLSHRPQDSASATTIGRASALVAVVWLCCGAITTSWAADKHAAFSDLLSVFCGWAVVIGASRSGSPKDLMGWLTKGWLIAFLVTTVIGTLEVTTHHHLSNYVLAPYLEQGRGEELSASTFGNPNAYALFLALGAPVLLYLVSMSRSTKEKACYVLLMLCLYAMLLYSGGRLGIAATVLSVMAWCVCTRRALRTVGGIAILLGLILLVTSNIWGAVAAPAHLPAPPEKMADFNTGTLRQVSTDAAIELNSGNVRLNLARSGWDMILESKGLGVGPGNFPVWVADRGDRYPVGGTFSPHNAVLELAGQYGLIAAVSALALFVLTVIGAVRLGVRPRGFGGPAAVLVLGVGVGLPLSGLCSSSFWDLPSTWVVMAIFLTAGALAWDAKRGPSSRPRSGPETHTS